MQILVNHLTSMQPGFICVAGINVQSRQHIRPVHSNRLTTDLLANNGGPFALASLVDLGEVRPCGTSPEIEDHLFNPSNVQVKGTIAYKQFWQLLQTVAKTSLYEIFGTPADHHGYAVDKGAGSASLGCLRPATSPHLYINNFNKIRLHVSDRDFDPDLAVTDIRLWEPLSSSVSGLREHGKGLEIRQKGTGCK
jgi:hypothetical protein